MCCIIPSALKDTPYNAPVFKGVMLLPITGHVVQIWKRSILCNELKEIRLDDVDIKSYEGKERFNNSVAKATEIINFDAQSFNWGRISDIALIVIGIAILYCAPDSFTTLGGGLACFGVASLFGRKFVVLFMDLDKRAAIVKKRPEGGILNGYAAAF